MSATKTADAVRHENLAAALAAVQMEIPAVSKGNTASVKSEKGSYSYSYADLAEITPLILPLLGKNGLAFMASPTMQGEAFVLHYVLAHESGQSLEGAYPLPDPVRARPQEIGSAITYARRYALCAVTGVAPGGDDDDAAAANDKPAAGRKPHAQKPAEPEPPVLASPGTAGLILDANTVEELRGIYEQIEGKGELGRAFAQEDAEHLAAVVAHHGLKQPPAGVKVSQMINAVKAAMEAADSKPESEPAPDPEPPAALDADWDVAPIPDDGSGS